MSGSPDDSLSHALRWYNHIASYGSEKACFPGDSKTATEQHLASATTNSVAKKDEDDEDVDLFGSSSVSF
jgi:elongation factor 1-beta